MAKVLYTQTNQEILFTDGFDGTNGEVRIVLVGRTGSGKSSTGNTILDQDYFQSEVAASSITRKCRYGTADRFGRKLTVVDTPGLFDTNLSNDEIMTEILKCIGLASPGPHAILLVVGVGRFTEEERNTIKLLQNIFGDDMTKYVIVVYTRKDELERGNKTLDDIIQDGPPCLREFLRECDGRKFAINNNASAEEKFEQTGVLLEMIDEMVEKNERQCYVNNNVFPVTEDTIRCRMKELNNRYHQNILEYKESASYEHRVRMQGLIDKEEALNRKLATYIQMRDEDKSKLDKLKLDLRDLKSNIEPDQFDEENNIQIERLKQGIDKIERDIFQVRSEILREECREEIEKGDETIIKRFWSNIAQKGSVIRRRIKNMFAAIVKQFR